jgi:hypothetical protein
VVVGHEDAARQTTPRLSGATVKRPLVRHGNVSGLVALHERWRAEV